jgi:hypothetical protein
MLEIKCKNTPFSAGSLAKRSQRLTQPYNDMGQPLNASGNGQKFLRVLERIAKKVMKLIEASGTNICYSLSENNNPLKWGSSQN